MAFEQNFRFKLGVSVGKDSASLLGWPLYAEVKIKGAYPRRTEHIAKGVG